MKPIINENCFVVPPLAGPSPECSHQAGQPYVSSPTPEQATIFVCCAKDDRIPEDPYFENDNAD